jgi:enterochelin esterase-like enzyme
VTATKKAENPQPHVTSAVSLRRLLPTMIVTLLLVPARLLGWGPALERSLRGQGVGAGQAQLVEGLLMAALVAAVVIVGTRRIWLATVGGTAAAALTLGSTADGWGITNADAPFRAAASLLAGALLCSFASAASVGAVADALTSAWRLWASARRPTGRLAALVPILGVFLVMLALAIAPDLIPPPPTAVSAGSTAAAGTLLPAPYSPNGPSTGRIIRDAFYSQSMRQVRVFNIYLPASYALVQSQHRAYPVLYLLHGDDGTVDDWPAIGLRELIDARLSAGSLPEMIVVMPDGSGAHNDETDWANRWDGSEPVEDQVLELVGNVDQTYRTLADRSFRFIGGLSSGGFGALNIALHHSDLFSVSMGFSGFTSAADPAVDPGVFGADPAYIDRNSPAVLVRTVPAAASIYYVLAAGLHDQYFQSRMRAFNVELTDLGLAHEFHVVPGGHDPDAWAAGLEYGLDYLGRVLPRHPDPVPGRQ